MAHITGFNMEQIMKMLSTALTREFELWMKCDFATSNAQEDVVCASDRSRVVDWFMTLNQRFCFNPETLFTSVTILDRFLNMVKVKPKYLKCVAVTCFYLGAKTTEEEECIPSTRDLVRRTECGCSISEVHRMELCILNKFNWDLRMSTPLDFLQMYHGLVMSLCPDLLNGFPPMLPSQHLHQVTLVLQQCLLHHQLSGFAPSVLALAILSLDLEDTFHCRSPLIDFLQKFAQINQKDLFWCEKVILRCLNREVSSPFLDRYLALREWAPTKRRVDKDNDDIYDGIRCLYGEEVADSSLNFVRMTCASQAVRLTSSSLLKPTFAS